MGQKTEVNVAEEEYAWSSGYDRRDECLWSRACFQRTANNGIWWTSRDHRLGERIQEAMYWPFWASCQPPQSQHFPEYVRRSVCCTKSKGSGYFITYCQRC